jgi:DNA-directed RNA polymerase beta' subunit
LKGGKDSARRFGSMEIGALVGHGGAGSEVLKDAKLIRGQENNEFWRAVRNGDQLPKVDIPLVNRKFFAHLQAAGVNLEDRGNRIHMFAADDNDVKRLTQNRQLQNNSTYDAKELRPISGGLFDPAIFGPQGDQWAYYQLPEPMLNPLMEKSVANILGWKESDLQGVLNGEQQIDGKVGPQAVQETLAKLDVEREFNKAKEQLKSSTLPALKRDKLLKKYRALGALLKEGKNPSDLFLTRIPILPPRFRPVSVLGNDVGIVSDANYLYKAMIDAANDFQEAKQVLPDEMQLDARKNLHQAVTSVIGLTDSPDRKLQEKGVEGVLKWAFGKGSPKFGSLHRKIYGATTDLGGLAVLSPDSRIGIDEVGLPADSAWSAFEPFVVRNLRRKHNYSLADAMKAVQDRTPRAKEALEEELKKRPILMNRAPTLHKYNLLALWPKLTEGNTLRYNPLISKGFNADHDGDVGSFHVPVSKKAVREAVEKMLPSKNLFNPATLDVYEGVPVEEFAQGLYLASRPGKGTPVKFKTKADMLRALNAGEIKYDTPVDIERMD